MRKIILMLTLILTATNAWSMTETQKQQFKAVLKAAGYTSAYYDKDQSMNIKADGVNYWFTLEEMGNLLKIQMNRKGYTLKGEKKYERRPAMQAVNDVNAKYPLVKMFCTLDTTSIKICAQFVLEEITDLKPSMIKNGIQVLGEASETFSVAYQRYLTNYKRIQERRQQQEEAARDTAIVVDQGSVSPLTYQGFSLQNVGSNDKPIASSGGEGRIFSRDAKFLKPTISIESQNAGRFEIRVRILNPDGKILKRSADSSYAIETPIEVKKAGRQYSFELDKFGSQTGGIWIAGEYTFEFYEGENLLSRETFKIEK